MQCLFLDRECYSKRNHFFKSFALKVWPNDTCYTCRGSNSPRHLFYNALPQNEKNCFFTELFPTLVVNKLAHLHFNVDMFTTMENRI